MGLWRWAKQRAFQRWLRRVAKEASVGKMGAAAKSVWGFFDGWKSWIVAVVAVYKLAFPQAAYLGYLDSALLSLGWDQAAQAFDPKQAMEAGLVLAALGHRFMKAVREWRAGVPLPAVLSQPELPLQLSEKKALWP